jgi:DNA invertase Pin-like site-specific DNA recombinase
MQIGYARSSTVDQEAGYQAQLKALKAAGCEKVFAEQVSSVAQREQLEAAIEYARDGDALVVTKLDQLARSVSHLVTIGEQLEAKGVSLRVLEQAIDTASSTGRHRSVRARDHVGTTARGHGQSQGRRQIQGPRTTCTRQGQ